MADIINLRRVRKNKLREDEAKHADVNRVKFGQSKADKRQHKAESKRAETAFEAHKRED